MASLVTGKGMAAEPVFKSDWLTPSSRLISGADLDRTVLMMAALSNPHPAPSVPERQRGTVAGRRADAEIKLKSASVSAAQAALADVAAAYAPAGYRNAVPDLEERSGIESASRTSPDRETGNYSSMQYLEARAGYFSSLRMADDVNRMIAADVLRNIYHIEAEAFSLNVQRYRADLHRNAVLSAMLGIVTEEDTDGEFNPDKLTRPQKQKNVVNALQRGKMTQDDSGQAKKISPTSNRASGGLSKLPHLDGISYQIVPAQDGLECILATGNTAEKKEQLSAAGFHWNPQRKIWWKYAA